MMNTSVGQILHVVPGDSACGSLRQALMSAGREDRVLAFRDDLSCGPIHPDDPVVREEWWNFEDDDIIRDSTISFWNVVQSTTDRLVVWYARHSARDLAFFLHWADRLGDRPYDEIDVTGLCLPHRDREGRRTMTKPLVSIGITPTDALPALFGTERASTPPGRRKAAEAWRRLKSENAYFRIVDQTGLVSAPEDHFDASLIDCASHEWQQAARVVGGCLSQNWEPFVQINDMVLSMRLAALVEAGRLLADGNVWPLANCRVRRPD